MLVTSIVATILSLGSMASAITIRTFTSPNTCGGTAFDCLNVNPDACCAVPQGYGYSVQFFSLGQFNHGRVYSEERCTNLIIDLPGPGTRCWNGRGISRAGSVRFNSNVRHQRDIKERSTEADCVAPSAFTYTDAEGKSQAIKVPDIASANTIAELASAENFAALAKYEPYNPVE